MSKIKPNKAKVKVHGPSPTRKRYTKKGLATSVRIAQNRHRSLENVRIGRLENQGRKQRSRAKNFAKGKA